MAAARPNKEQPVVPGPLASEWCRRAPSGTYGATDERLSASRLFLLRHPALHDSAERNKREPLLTNQREPSAECCDRRIVRMADGDRAAVLLCELLDPGELFSDPRRRRVVVEEHVTRCVRDPVSIIALPLPRAMATARTRRVDPDARACHSTAAHDAAVM